MGVIDDRKFKMYLLTHTDWNFGQFTLNLSLFQEMEEVENGIKLQHERAKRVPLEPPQ